MKINAAKMVSGVKRDIRGKVSGLETLRDRRAQQGLVKRQTCRIE
jgi:hypothetical protein